MKFTQNIVALAVFGTTIIPTSASTTDAPSGTYHPTTFSPSTSSPSIRGSSSSSSSSTSTTTSTSTTKYSILPGEDAPHAATWLQWPHPYEYGNSYRKHMEPMWVDMTKALVSSEPVYIIVYDDVIQQRAEQKLNEANVDMTDITFVTIETNDVWVRDNGPIFVHPVDRNKDVELVDFGFNGWGGDARYYLDNRVPIHVADYLDMFLIDETTVELEGGAIEVDGNGVLMATKSSTIENGRNPGMTAAEMEDAMYEYLGVEKVIWLDGKYGGTEDITDFHIDGFARFGTPDTIVTMDQEDLLYWGVSQKDVNTLMGATDVNGNAYNFLNLPLSQNNVVTTYGEDLGYRGSYVNFYTGNTVVLIPSYNDPNDEVARQTLQTLYPDRTVVSVDARNLLKNGGMIHCVTKQQAAGTIVPQTTRNRQIVEDALNESSSSSSMTTTSKTMMMTTMLAATVVAALFLF